MKSFLGTILFFGGIPLLLYIWGNYDDGWVICVAIVTLILTGGIAWPVASVKDKAKTDIAVAKQDAGKKIAIAEEKLSNDRNSLESNKKYWMDKQAKIEKEWNKKQKEREATWLATQKEWREKDDAAQYRKMQEQKELEAIWTQKQKEILNNLLEELSTNLTDRQTAYKWLAPLIADVKIVLEERNRRVDELVSSKRPPESKVRVNVLINEKKQLEEENATLKYYLDYIRTLIPETEDIIERDEYSTETKDADNPYHFLSKEEYKSLPDRKKNEMALEHYKNRKKRNWEIGRDFERFIGYEYECLGYEVEYFGIEKRLEDLGRDLIVKKDGHTLIIQCKYWSKNKTIHEKHIAQLYGTVAMYELCLELNLLKEIVRGVFVTHATLSDEAKRFARKLHIEVVENKEQGEYPLIKCNVNKNRETGEVTRIYHLPMDQQYDTTKIDTENRDCYAFTVEEAENKGFRRAYRWHGDGGE